MTSQKERDLLRKLDWKLCEHKRTTRQEEQNGVEHVLCHDCSSIFVYVPDAALLPPRDG